MLNESTPLHDVRSDGKTQVAILTRAGEATPSSPMWLQQMLEPAGLGPEAVHVEYLTRSSGQQAQHNLAQQLHEGLAAGRWDIIVAEHLSDIARDLYRAIQLVRAAHDHGVRVIVHAEGLDSADANSWVALHFVAFARESMNHRAHHRTRRRRR